MPRRRGPKKKPELRAILSVPELAALANVARFVMGRVLAAARVPMHRRGIRRLVYLADLKRKLPVLWESIEEYGLM